MKNLCGHRWWLESAWIAFIICLIAPAPLWARDVSRDQGGQSNWEMQYTFSGGGRKPGLYTVDPHIWVYTREFADRFGMPEKWVDPELVGIEAAAWRKTKNGMRSCGWGGKEAACREEANGTLEIYINIHKVDLPWAAWARESDQLDIYWAQTNSQSFLTPQAGESECRRAKSESPIGRRTWTGCSVGVERQPFADLETGDEIFLFNKAMSYEGQGNFNRVWAYDKRAYPDLSWIQIGYTRSVGLYNPPEAAIIRMETRTAPLGKTLRRFHEFILPQSLDRRIKEVLDAEREADREFYKKSLDMK